jgi:hypothetical protein
MIDELAHAGTGQFALAAAPAFGRVLHLRAPLGPRARRALGRSGTGPAPLLDRPGT